MRLPERGSCRSARGAGHGIVDGRTGAAHIAGSNGSRRNGNDLGRKLSNELAVIAGEIEQLVLYNVSAYCPACLIVDELRKALSNRLKERLGLAEGVVLTEQERRTMDLVSSAFQLNIDGGTSGEALVGIQAIAGNGDGLDGIQTRNVSGFV